MKEQDEFSDILLEQEGEQKTSKVKKIAIIVAVFMLIFIIVLVIMRLINPSESKTSTNNKTPIKQTTKPVVEAKDDPLFKQVPIIKENSKKESFDELVKKLREKELKKEAEKKAEVKINKPKKEVDDKLKIVAIKNIQVEKNQSTKKVQKPAIKEKAKPKKNAIVNIPFPKGYTKSGNIYIQVLATSKFDVDKRYIGKIKSKKYPYELFKTNVKGTPFLKVLIGPYKSKKDAKNALPQVRKDINSKAFIFAK